MALPTEVSTAAADAAAAVQALASPALPAHERHRLYQLCESLRESPMALQCALCLSAGDQPDIVRHLGLQILESTIKFHWNDLPVEQKVLLKDSSLELMAGVQADAPAYMRDALCRPMVEMVKREWPQQYVDFVSDMSRLAARGPLHTELVLRVFLRLAEDVATFQTLSAPARRRDIYRGLVAKMDTLLSVMSATLAACVSEGTASPLARTCLATLDCYLEWASVPLLMGSDGELLKLLIRLLTQPDLRQSAAGCLAVLLSRHGALDQREPLLMVFSPSVVSLLSDHVLELSTQPPSDPTLATLRLLAQALAAAVSQLCYCWGRDGSTVQQPGGWADFVALLLRLTQLPVVGIAVILLPAWTQLLRHKQAGTSAPVLSATVPLLEVIQQRARPRWAEPPEVAVWRQLEMYGGVELRQALAGCLRALTAAAPDQVVTQVAADVTRVVQTPLPSDGGGALDKHAPQRADLEVATWMTDQVSSVAAGDPNAAPSAAVQAAGQSLLATCLERKTLDPDILSLLVSLLSSLALFLPQQPSLAGPLITRIFDAVDFTSSDPSLETSTRELRRHGCNAFLGLALRRPETLTASWPALLERITSMLQEPGRLSPAEGVALTELLVVVYSHIGNYVQQSELIGGLLAPHTETWKGLITACASPAAFVSAIGLDSPPESADPEKNTTRQRLNCFVSLLSNLLQRSRPPKDADRLAKEGFVDSSTGAARSPAAPHILPHMPLVFQLVRCLSSLDAPHVRALFHPAYAGALGIHPGKYAQLLRGAVERSEPDDGPRSPLEKMRRFLTHIHDTVHALLAGAFSTLDRELLNMPRLQEYLAGSVLHELKHLSDHRIPAQVRGVWRYALYRCPLDQAPSLLHPLLATLIEELADRLDTRWTQLKSEPADDAENGDDEEDPEALVAEMLTRQLTRESAALLGIVLTSTGPSSPSSASVGDAEEAMEEDSPTPSRQVQIGAGGRAALTSPVLARPLLVLLFKCIGWGDSQASLKATGLAPMVINALSEAGLVDNAAASQLLYWLLHGLQVQGHYEANYTALSQAVTAACLCLWPSHPAAVSQVLVQVPEASPETVDKLREKIFTHPKVSKSDKMRREEIRRFVKPLVSCSMSQLFQKKVCIRDLLPMPAPDRKPPKQEVVSLAELFGDT